MAVPALLNVYSTKWRHTTQKTVNSVFLHMHSNASWPRGPQTQRRSIPKRQLHTSGSCGCWVWNVASVATSVSRSSLPGMPLWHDWGLTLKSYSRTVQAGANLIQRVPWSQQSQTTKMEKGRRRLRRESQPRRTQKPKKEAPENLKIPKSQKKVATTASRS